MPFGIFWEMACEQLSLHDSLCVPAVVSFKILSSFLDCHLCKYVLVSDTDTHLCSALRKLMSLNHLHGVSHSHCHLAVVDRKPPASRWCFITETALQTPVRVRPYLHHHFSGCRLWWHCFYWCSAPLDDTRTAAPLRRNQRRCCHSTWISWSGQLIQCYQMPCLPH